MDCVSELVVDDSEVPPLLIFNGTPPKGKLPQCDGTRNVQNGPFEPGTTQTGQFSPISKSVGLVFNS